MEEIENATSATMTSDPNTEPAEVVANAAEQVEGSKGGQDDGTLLGKASEKPGETAPAEPGKAVPEKYEVAAPEGMELDADMLEAFTPVFKDLGLGNEGVQKLVDAYAPKIAAMMQQQQEQAVSEFKTVIDGWKSETVKDLGADANREMAYAGKFIDKVGSPELRKILDDTGVGNNIHFVRAFIKAGKMFAADSYPDQGGNRAEGMDDGDRAKALFPSMKE